MTSTAISPFVVGDLTKVELADGQGKKKRVWRKQLLPAGTRHYEGQTLDFSQINPACLTAFNEGAFDAVPFVLALSDNKHPQEGEEAKQLEGDVVKLELAEDGSLYGYLDLHRSAGVENIIKKSNGKYGVSCKVEIDYTAKDSGKHWDYALSHVCGTTRPHIKGLEGWRPIELSEEEKKRPTIDFSYKVEDEAPVDDKETENNDENEGDLVPLEIPKDQAEALLAMLKEWQDIPKSAEEIEEEDDEDESVELPDDAKKKIAAAEAASARALELAESMQKSAASERWAAQRSVLLSEGVPPAVLDLAGKVLSRHRPVTLEFAENDVVDASAVIRDILDECKGVIALGEEGGHQFSDGRDNKKDKEYEDLVASFNMDWVRDGRDR